MSSSGRGVHELNIFENCWRPPGFPRSGDDVWPFWRLSSKSPEKQSDDFFTSDNREADQRARKTVSEDEDKDAPENGRANVSAAKNGVSAESKQTLYYRLGAEADITAIVDNFIKRALEDPRVNWSREGVKRGGLFRRQRSVAWNPTPENVTRLKKHFVQFITLAAGGPANYDGKDIKSTHANMRITQPEFDAAIGDLKASLDNLKIPAKEQRELLAILESTRPQIIPERR